MIFCVRATRGLERIGVSRYARQSNLGSVLCVLLNE